MKFLLVFLCLFINHVLAQYRLSDVRVTESQFNVSSEQALGNYEIIDGNVIDTQFDGDALRAIETTSSIHLTQSGGLGQFASVFVRGNNSNRVLVMVDGVELNDPSESGRGFVMETLSGLDIESIEILKGAQSGVYGSDAIAGVINIVTKKTYKSKKKLIVGAGSYGRRRLAITEGRKLSRGWFRASFDYVKQDGISAALGGRENDGATRGMLQLKYGLANYNATLRIMDLSADTDRGANASNDDPNNQSNLNTISFSNQYKFSWGKNKSKLNFNYSKFDREYSNDVDTQNSTNQDYLYDSSNLKLNWANNLKLSSYQFVYGLEFERDEMSNESVGDTTAAKREEDLKTTSVFTEIRKYNGAFSHSLALRGDKFSNDLDAFTYRFLNEYRQSKKIKWYLSFATGFKNPSLYQLYDPSYGNEDLTPEKSDEQEIGLKFGEGRRFVELSLFNQDIKDLIEWDTTYKNTGRASFEGGELKTSFVKNGHWLDYSFTRVIAKSKDQRLDKRPIHKWTLSHRFKSLQTRLMYVGNRKSLPSYYIADFFIKKEKFGGEFNLKLGNIFNRDYQEVAGYTTLGRNISLNYRREY